jgi:curved DNA-binding protein CbpA
MRDYYAVLGVAKDADPEVVRAAYRALAKKYHPDTSAAGNNGSTERFREISAAYSVLSDAEQRAVYDQSIYASSSPLDSPRAPSPGPQGVLDKVQYSAAALLVFGVGGFVLLLLCVMAAGLIVGAVRP